MIRESKKEPLVGARAWEESYQVPADQTQGKLDASMNYKPLSSVGAPLVRSSSSGI